MVVTDTNPNASDRGTGHSALSLYPGRAETFGMSLEAIFCMSCDYELEGACLRIHALE